jgi:pSer/pThr/pTyr-binding forkhead associated (FHA) protein
MECVIKIVAGPESGQEFRCPAGETVIGRSPRSAIRLSAASVSYEHAVISQGVEGYFVENLSANGTYLNNERVSGKARLRARDQLRIGEETVARVESVPTGTGGGTSRVTLLALLVALLFIGLVVVVADPFSGSSERDWGKANTRLQQWVAAESAAGRLPRETGRLLGEAWRLESAGDRKNASKAWVRLRVYLASSEPGMRYQQYAQEDRRALSRLLEMEDAAAAQGAPEQMGAALVQFVSQMERRN